MTTSEEAVRQPSAASELLSTRERTRLIAVGVRDADHDATTIDWALSEATAAVDVLHIVHAYVPLLLPGCEWDPVVWARDARHVAAKHKAALAAQRAEAQHSGVQIGVSAIAGEPTHVFDQMSDIVDLIVVGDDAAAPGRYGKIAWRVQDSARCPVVCVPPGCDTSSERPVTLVADDRGRSDRALGFAEQAAARRRVPMQVSRAWTSLHREPAPDPRMVAEAQELLDGQLADLGERYPHLGVISRIELTDDWLAGICRRSSLVVAGTRSAAAVRSVAAAPLGCPTAIVPDWD